MKHPTLEQMYNMAFMRVLDIDQEEFSEFVASIPGGIITNSVRTDHKAETLQGVPFETLFDWFVWAVYEDPRDWEDPKQPEYMSSGWRFRAEVMYEIWCEVNPC